MSDTTRPTARDALVEAAFAVFSRDPSASLSAIAERAGVGRATLHRYFASREALIHALARIAIEEMEAATEAACADVPTHGEALRRTLEALIPLGDRHGFLALEPVEDDAQIAAAFAAQQRETRAAVEGAIGEGMFDDRVPAAWIVQAYDHLLYAAWESVRAGEATPTQAAALAWRTLTTGCGGSHDA